MPLTVLDVHSPRTGIQASGNYLSIYYNVFGAAGMQCSSSGFAVTVEAKSRETMRRRAPSFRPRVGVPHSVPVITEFNGTITLESVLNY